MYVLYVQHQLVEYVIQVTSGKVQKVKIIYYGIRILHG